MITENIHTTTSMLASNDLPDVKSNRRAFMKRLGLGAVGAAVMGAAEGDFSEAYAQSIAPSDVVQFALNFEYLGATYYLTAVTGQGLSAGDMGANPGQVIGGTRSNFQSAVIGAFAAELAVDERNHTEVLRAALTANGITPISMPTIDISNSFTALAKASGVALPFSPYTSDMNFLLGAFILEDVCVTALKGSAALLMGSPYLATAARFPRRGSLPSRCNQNVLVRNGAIQSASGKQYNGHCADTISVGELR